MSVVGMAVTLAIFGLFTGLLIALSISEGRQEKQAREAREEAQLERVA